MADKKPVTGEPGSARRGKKHGLSPTDEEQRDLLRRIHLKEQELEDLVLEARRTAGQILERARAEAEALISKQRETASHEVEREVQQGLLATDGEVSEIASAAASEARDVERDAGGRVDQVAAWLLRVVLPPAAKPEGER